jgi:predicted RNA-binding Zn-ribbon protein involved in translation (DUF1610 family)
MTVEAKFLVKGAALSIGGFFLLMWGVSDLVFLFDAPISLIFIIPAVISVIFFCLMVLLYMRAKKKSAIFDEKTIHYCGMCGAQIKLSEVKCGNCGADNMRRKEALDKLANLEMSNTESRLKIQEKAQSKKWRTPASKKQDRRFLELLDKQTIKIKETRMKILIGSTLEAKKKWVETQYRELGRSFREIADELGESMITVKQYLDSDSEKDERELY